MACAWHVVCVLCGMRGVVVYVMCVLCVWCVLCVVVCVCVCCVVFVCWCCVLCIVYCVVCCVVCLRCIDMWVHVWCLCCVRTSAGRELITLDPAISFIDTGNTVTNLTPAVASGAKREHKIQNID